MSNNTQDVNGDIDLSNINNWSGAEYARLTPEMISAMSNDQVHSLNHTDFIPPSAASGFTAEQIPHIRTRFKFFSAEWLNSLTTPAFQAITAEQLNQITPAALAGLDVFHRSELTPEQVAGMTNIAAFSSDQFSDLDISGLSAAAIQSWGTTQYAGLTAQQLAFMSTDLLNAMQHVEWMPASAVAGLTHAQLTQLNVNFSVLPADWLNNLAPDVLTTLTSDQLNQMSTDVLAGLNDDLLASLSAAQVSAMTNLGNLSSAQFGQLTISGLSDDAISNLSQTEYEALTAQQIATLSPAQIHAMSHPDWLSAAAINGLTADQVKNISLGMNSFSVEWLNNLSLDAFKALTATQINQISLETHLAINKAHIAALTPEQVSAISYNFYWVTPAWMNCLNIPALQAITATQLNQLSSESLSQLDKTHASALTAAQIASWSTTFYWLTPVFLNNLNTQAFQAITAAHFNEITREHIAALDNEHIAALTTDMLTGMDDWRLSSFTAQQVAAITKLNALSSAQFGNLNISGLTVSDIAVWTQTEYAGVTASQIGTLSINQIQAMAHQEWLPDAAIAGFTEIQTPLLGDILSRLSPAQVNSLSHRDSLSSAQFGQLNISGLSDDALGNLNNTEYAGLTAQQIATLSPAQIHAMSHPDWLPAVAVNALSADQIKSISISMYWFSLEWLNSLNTQALQAMSATQLNQLSSANLSQLDKTHASALTAAQIASWSTTFYWLTPTFLNNLNTQAFQAITAAHFNEITREHIAALDNEHIAALTTDMLTGMDDWRLSSFTAQQVAAITKLDALSSAQFGNLNISGLTVSDIAGWTQTEYAGVTASQIGTLSLTQLHAMQHPEWLPDAAIGGFTEIQTPLLGDILSRLTATQVNSMSHLDTLSSAQFGQLNISGLSDDALGNLNNTEYAGLTAQQITTLSPAQIHALNHPDGLPAVAVNALSAEQIKSISISMYWFSVKWLNSLNIQAFQAITAAHLNEITCDKFAALDTAHVAALTADMLKGLDDEHLSSFTAAQVSAITHLDALSSAQFASMGQAQYEGLTAQQIAGMSAEQLHALQHVEWMPPSAIAGLTAAQVSQLNVNLSGLSAAWLNALTPEVFGALDIKQLDQISPDVVAALDEAHRLVLPDVQVTDFTTVTAVELNRLSAEAFKALTADQLNQISATTLAGLNNTHLSELSAAKVAAMTNLGNLSSEQFGLLDISGMSPATLNGMSWSEYCGLTAKQLASLSNEQLAVIDKTNWVNNPAFAGIKPSQVAAFIPWVYFLSVEQLNYLPLDTFKAVEPSRMASVTADTLKGLDDDHLAALTAKQIASMNNLGGLNSHQFGLLNISEMSVAAISGWTEAEYAGLTANQLATLALDQLRAMQHTDWVPVAISDNFKAALSPDFSTVSADWLNRMNLETFKTITPDQLNRIADNVLTSLDDAHIAALTGAQITGMTHLNILSRAQFALLNVNALSSEQISQLNIAGLTADNLNSLSIAFLQQLSADQLNQVSNATLAALDDAHLKALTTAQVAVMTHLDALSNQQFGLLDISGTSPSAISHWTQAEYAGLTLQQVVTLNAEQVGAMQHPEWVPDTVRGSLAVAQTPDLSTVSATWFNNLSLATLQALTPEQLNKMSADTLAGLDDAHLSALTATQVAAMKNLGTLSQGQFGLLDISNMTASLSEERYAALTAKQVASLSVAQLNAMSHANWIPDNAVAALSASQIAGFTFDFQWFTSSWLNNLSPDAFKALTVAQIKQIKPDNLAGLDAAHIALFTAQQTPGIADNASSLTASWLNTLTPQAFSAVSLNKISLATLSGLDSSHLAALTATQAQTLTADLSSVSAPWLNNLTISALIAIPFAQLSEIGTAAIAGLDSAHQAAFSEKMSYLHLTAQQISAMSQTDFLALKHQDWLQAATASGLTPAQIRAMTVNFAAFSADWLNHLSVEALKALSPVQLHQIDSSTVLALDNAHLRGLSAEQVAAMSHWGTFSADPLTSMTNLNQLNSAQFGLLDISALPISVINDWCATQYNGLTAQQVASLSPEQINALWHADWLPVRVASAITAALAPHISTSLSYLSANWLNAMNIAAWQAFTPAQINQIKATTLAALDDAHLHTLTAAQVSAMKNLSELSSTQIELLDISSVTADWLNGLSVTEFSFLSDTQIASLSDTVRTGLDATHQAALNSMTPFSALSAAQIPLFTGNFATLSANELNQLSVEAFRAITTDQIQQIAPSTLRDLDKTRLGALTGAQIEAMTVNLASFSATWLNSLSLPAFQAIKGEQFAAMKPSAIAQLDPAHIAMLANALASFSDDELLVIGAHLTQQQRSLLSANQQSLLSASDSLGNILANSLNDDSLKNIMKSLLGSGASVFSFSGIESILKTFATKLTGPLTADQYHDLNSYLQDIGSVCGVNSSIYGLINGLITGENGASVTWAYSGPETRIGNLKPGASAQVFNQLISSWMDGINNPQNSIDRTSKVPLFAPGGPVISDIAQGGIGDCTFLSTLQAIVNTSSDYIKNMVVQNSNDTYSVRFFNNDKATWVTVDNEVCQFGADATKSSWPAIYERAYLAYVSTYRNEKNNYSSIDGAWANLMTNLTGDSITMLNADSYSDVDWNTKVFEQLKTAVLAGEPADISSWEATQDDQGNGKLVSGHMFAIIGFDEHTNDFIVSNPWGSSGHGTFEASMEELREHGHSAVAILNTSGATGVVGQLVTAMALATPTAAASSAAAPAPTLAPRAELVAAHI